MANLRATRHIDGQRTMLNHSEQPTFLRRLLTTVAVVTVVVLGTLVLWYGAEIFLLVFAGLLLAVFLRSLTTMLRDHSPLSDGWALGVVIFAIIAVIAAGVWFLTPSVTKQVNQLTQTLPQAMTQARQQIARYPLGQELAAQIPQVQQLLPKPTNILSQLTGVFSTALNVIVNIAIIVFAGIYFAANPELYRRGIMRLFPMRKRDRVQDVLDTLGHTLGWGITGRLTVMAINGAITALCLWLLGIPLPLLLGLITGLLNFIPNIGPILAAVPAVLLALTIGPTKALYVALLYVAVQALEGFVLTPLVQQRTVSLPPVLLITAQILFGIMFGFLGVLLAVPLTAVAFVLVRMLYVEDTLGDSVQVPGEDMT